MEKIPHENDSPAENSGNPVQNNPEAKETSKKIVFKADDATLGLENLPAEASELFKNIMSSIPPGKINMESIPPEKSMSIVPNMDQQAQDLLKRMVMQEKISENDARKVTDSDNKIENQDLKYNSAKVEQLPDLLTSPPPVKSRNNNLTIDETGSIFGIKIGISTRKEIIEIMKTKSKINNSGNIDTILKYDDAGINFHFGDGGILHEISLVYPFEGETFEGLQIFDSIHKAIKLYGQPKIRTQKGAIWNTVSIFLQDDTIITIRLRST